VRVAHRRSRHHDRLDVTAGQDFLSLHASGNHAHRIRRDLDFATNSLRQLDLVARTDRNGGVHYVATARSVNEINAPLGQDSHQLDRVIDRPAAVGPVGCREPDEERRRSAHRTNGVDHGHQETTAIFK